MDNNNPSHVNLILQLSMASWGKKSKWGWSERENKSTVHIQWNSVAQVKRKKQSLERNI